MRGLRWDAGHVLLTVEELSKKYNEKAGLVNLNFSLEEGEILGLVGPNGAGKSTSIKALLGLIEADHGHVWFGPERMPVAYPEVKRLIGYVPEFPILYSDLTIREHAHFLGMAYGLSKRELASRYDELVRRFDLLGKEDKPAIYLSKGMEQKLSMLCALIFRPRILIADEPFNGLDPKGQRELKDMLADIKERQGGVLLCTHQLDTAEKVCDRFLILNEGQQIALGTLEELRNQAQLGEATLESVFLALTQEALG